MNTFLAYNDFVKNAKVLDNKRLNKQVLECSQILNVILVKKGIRFSDKTGWHNHPVYNIWTDKHGMIYIYQLIKYTDVCFTEWKTRGFKNVSWEPKRDMILNEIRGHVFGNKKSILTWSDEFHKTMQANLIRKDAARYSKYFGNLIPKDKYIWENCKIK